MTLVNDDELFGLALVHRARELTVISASDVDTAEPLVAVSITVDGDHATYSYSMSPDDADALAAALVRWAAHARSR
jgi:hypothetical protein